MKQNGIEASSQKPQSGGMREGLIQRWRQIAILAVLSAYFYTFIEWLFQVTKPSFMDPLPWGTRLGILTLTGLALSGAGLLALLIPAALSLAPWPERARRIFLWIGAGIPAVFLAAAGLMMVDNFTYTLFKFGIVTAVGPIRGAYALFFLFLLAEFARRIVASPAKRRPGKVRANLSAYACAAILALSIPLGGWLALRGGSGDEILPDTGGAERRPNILLIGSDGLNASRLSTYGYGLETTPFLSELARESLLAENNFPNANITAGSLASMFTGRLPTETRALFPPDTLRGENAFRHLPGILKKEGYYTAQLSVDYYGDAESVNLREGFQVVNGRTSTDGGLYSFSRRRLPDESAYFLSTSAKRLSERLAHSFYLREMPNPYAQVTGGIDSSSDLERIEQLFSIFHTGKSPWFVHIHLMGTHQYLYDSYDQAVRIFDEELRLIVQELERLGDLDDTLLIVYSDHGKDNERLVRTPLVMRFPGGEHAGRLRTNTQNLDIAPTVLNYLGLEQPDWMGGRSLLQGQPPAARPIFSTAPNYRRDNGQGRLELDLSKIGPPFYQFGSIDLILCQRWYSLDTTTHTWSSGRVEGHTAPCGPDELPDEDEAHRLLVERLRADGFDVSVMEESLVEAGDDDN